MKNIVKKFRLHIWALSLIAFTTVKAQSDNIETPIPLDSSLRSGQLSNGFTYYIKHVNTTGEKWKMRLYVNVGHYSQDNNQLNFAHIIEHLAFKAAKDFTVNLLDNPALLTRLGMTKDDIFGQTNSLNTWYSFDIPYDREDSLEEAFVWFQNISDLQMNPNMVNKEKGPIRQELIFRQGDDLDGFFQKSKLESTIFPCKQDYTDFFKFNADFDPLKVIDFYNEWYHPERMALVIVGDTTHINTVEGKIKSYFSNLKPKTDGITKIDCLDDYFNKPNQFVTLGRKTTEGIPYQESVKYYLYTRDAKTITQNGTWDGLKREIIWSMLVRMINQRFHEARNNYKSSFSAYMQPPYFTMPANLIEITTDVYRVETALKEVVQVLKRVKDFGFSEKEWNQAKSYQLRSLRGIVTTDTKYWMELFEDHISYGAPIPKQKNVILSQWLENLSLEDINTFAEESFLAFPGDIGIIAPKGHESLLHSEEDVRNYIAQILQEEVSPYKAPMVPKYLLNPKEAFNLPINGYTKKGTGKTGAKEFVLANGVNIVLQPFNPTMNKGNNRIRLHGYSPYGASSFPPANYFSAINAPSIVKNAGVGELNKFTLNRFLENTSFWQGVFPYIKYNETGIKGDAALKDLELLLQLVYLYFTQPRIDKHAYEDWQQLEIRNYNNPGYSLIQADFNVAMRAAVGDSSVTPKGSKRFQGLKSTDMHTAYMIYQKLFGNASEFTFIITGEVSEEKILPLVQKYLGNLPSKTNVSLDSKKGKSNKKKELSKGPLFVQISSNIFDAPYNMESVRYSLRYITKAVDPKDWKEHINIEVVGALMNSKIRKLRFMEEAALYNMIALSKFNRESMNYDFQMQIDCVPEELETLRRICKDMIVEIKKGAINKERFNEIISNKILPRYRAKENSQSQVLMKTYNHYRYNEPWLNLSDIENYIRSLELKDIQRTAQKYLKDENLIEFVMSDENFLP